MDNTQRAIKNKQKKPKSKPIVLDEQRIHWFNTTKEPTVYELIVQQNININSSSKQSRQLIINTQLDILPQNNYLYLLNWSHQIITPYREAHSIQFIICTIIILLMNRTNLSQPIRSILSQAQSVDLYSQTDTSLLKSTCLRPHIQTSQLNQPLTLTKLQSHLITDQNTLIQHFILKFYLILGIFCPNSFILAFEDQSHSLDTKFGFVPFTFRNWLWINFILSVLSISCMVKVFKLNVHIIQKDAQSILLDRMLLVWTSKIIWTVMGMAFYLGLDYENTHECVKVYCGVEFLVYILLLGPTLRKMYSDSGLKIDEHYEIQIVSEELHPQNQVLTQPNNQLSYSNNQTFFDWYFFWLLPRMIKVFSILGVVGNFQKVIYNEFEWIDQVLLEKQSLSFRQWLALDAIFALILWTFYFCFFCVCSEKKRLDQSVYKLESEQMTLKEGVFQFMMMIKVVWMVFGWVLYVWYIGIDKTRYAHYYLVIYFNCFYFLLNALMVQKVINNSKLQKSNNSK